MTRNTWLVLLLAIASTGCGKFEYNRTKTGLLYKIITTKDSKGPAAKSGNVLKIYLREKLNDSLLQTNYGKLPSFSAVQIFAGNNYTPPEIFPLLHKGDSAVVVMLVDSLVAKGMVPQLPPYMKRGDRIIFNLKVADLFANDSLTRIDYQKEMAIDMQRQKQEAAVEMAKDSMVISGYFSAHNIKAQRTPRGAYITITHQGDGMQADSGKLVSLKYKGTTLSGTLFDTNIDSSFHHPEPLEFVIGSRAVIPGLDEALRLLKKGATATIYVPAALGYGPQPIPEGGKPFQNLVFEVQVLDVKDKPVMQRNQPQRPDTLHRKK
jgi:FKBP-type peptidyl-prolyl cis-trans isomerase FkpA